MQEFEYKESATFVVQETLDHFAAEGWRFVGLCPILETTPTMYKVIFERQIQKQIEIGGTAKCNPPN